MSPSPVQRWQAVIDRMTFTHSPMPVTLTARCDEGSDDVELRCRLDSKDHATGAPLQIWLVERVDLPDLFHDEGMADVLARLVRRAFDHEAREFTMLDGKVFDDPHENDVPFYPGRMDEGDRLRARIAELEAKLAPEPAPEALVIDMAREVVMVGAVSKDIRRALVLKKLVFHFATHPRVEFTKEQLSIEVWGNQNYHPFSHDPSIHSSIQRVRALLGDGQARVLETTANGYRFVPPPDYRLVPRAS